MNTDPDPDIVEVIMRACQAEGLDAGVAHIIESRIRNEYGGQRMRIQKRKQQAREQKREQIRADGKTDMTSEQVAQKHGISRATLYRLMKRGAP
jgi:transcriptional regulator of acetoin/glycerol metabolism